MSPKMNSIFQIRKNRKEVQEVKREELMDRIFDSCISIQTYINSMDAQLDLYLSKARQAQKANSSRELSFAYTNIRTALTQKKVAEIMYQNLTQIRNQVKLNSLIQTFSCDVSAMANLCKSLNGTLNIKKVMSDYNEIMKPLESSKLQFDYFNEELLHSMDANSKGNMGISDEEIAALVNRQTVSDASSSRESYVSADSAASSKSQTTDSLRERLNRF